MKSARIFTSKRYLVERPCAPPVGLPTHVPVLTVDGDELREMLATADRQLEDGDRIWELRPFTTIKERRQLELRLIEVVPEEAETAAPELPL